MKLKISFLDERTYVYIERRKNKITCKGFIEWGWFKDPFFTYEKYIDGLEIVEKLSTDLKSRPDYEERVEYDSIDFVEHEFNNIDIEKLLVSIGCDIYYEPYFQNRIKYIEHLAGQKCLESNTDVQIRHIEGAVHEKNDFLCYGYYIGYMTDVIINADKVNIESMENYLNRFFLCSHDVIIEKISD